MTVPSGENPGYVVGGLRDARQSGLLDVRSFIALGAGLTAQGRTAYNESIYLRLAAEAIVHRVGEAVARLPADLVQAHPEIEFSIAKAMRNRVAHQSVDDPLLWEALAVDLPYMSRQIAALLARPIRDA